MKYQDVKNKLLSEPKVKKEYQRIDLAFEIAKIVIEARILKGITQDKLAKLVGTKQPSIARLENGSELPSLKFLQKIAKAVDAELLPPKFQFANSSGNELIVSKKVLYRSSYHKKDSTVVVSNDLKKVQTFYSTAVTS